jgi:hypothetical protein
LDVRSATAGIGCLQSAFFAGETYAGRTYYLAGAGGHQETVTRAIQSDLERRKPGDMRISVSQVRGMLGNARNVITVRWSVAYGYLICFAPGNDLFISVRVNYEPGCFARILTILPWFSIELDVFKVDDLNMMTHCMTSATEAQLEALQLAYLTREGVQSG